MKIIINSVKGRFSDECEQTWYIEGGGKSVTLNYIYTSKYDLANFAVALQKFPTSIKDEVCFQQDFSQGSCWNKLLIHKAKRCGLFYLRCFLFNNLGHAAMEIKARDEGSPPFCFDINFSIQCEVACLNKLGISLETWCKGEMSEPFEFSDYD